MSSEKKPYKTTIFIYKTLIFSKLLSTKLPLPKDAKKKKQVLIISIITPDIAGCKSRLDTLYRDRIIRKKIQCEEHIWFSPRISCTRDRNWKKSFDEGFMVRIFNSLCQTKYIIHSIVLKNR